VIVDDTALQTGNLLEEPGGGVSDVEGPQVAGNEIGNLLVQWSEDQFHVVLFHEFYDVLMDIVGVLGYLFPLRQFENTGVILCQRQAAGRAGVDDIVSPVDVFHQHAGIFPCIFQCPLPVSVPQCGEAAADLAGYDHPEPHGGQQVADAPSDVGPVVVEETAVEEDHSSPALPLSLPSPAGAEAAKLEAGEGYIGGYAQDAHQSPEEPDRGKPIDHRCGQGTEGSQEIDVGKHPVGQGPEVSRTIGELFTEDDLGGIDAVGTGHLASLALAAEPDPLIPGEVFVDAESFRVGSRLLGTGEGRIDLEDGTVLHADSASYAVLEIVVHRIYSSHFSAAATPVATAMP